LLVLLLRSSLIIATFQSCEYLTYLQLAISCLLELLDFSAKRANP